MRITSAFPARAVAAFAALTPSVLAAQEHAPAGAPPGLLTVDGGLMFWTLIVFIAIFTILAKFAFPAILGAVQAREAALVKAIEEAKADREAAAKLLADHKAQIDAARGDAQKLIADGRQTAEAMRSTMLEETRKQQSDLLERAKRDIETEKTAAIADLRREAVTLAIAAAGKVIEKNLDDAQNKKLVEGYLSSLN
ncbi:MAG: F0F1 ATP synthase subunit B [Gemmatimonadetes bacterium]|nr:F0F1 ATP synthase subunit B [Gemmatimonadota bacterium]